MLFRSKKSTANLKERQIIIAKVRVCTKNRKFARKSAKFAQSKIRSSEHSCNKYFAQITKKPKIFSSALHVFICRLFLRFSCFRSFRNRRFIKRSIIKIDFHFKMRIRFFCGTILPASRRLIACSKKFLRPLCRPVIRES